MESFKKVRIGWHSSNRLASVIEYKNVKISINTSNILLLFALRNVIKMNHIIYKQQAQEYKHVSEQYDELKIS